MTNSDDDAAFDESVRVAWQEFTDRLAARLTTLERPELIEMSTSTTSSDVPEMMFSMTGAGRLRCTIAGAALAGFWPTEKSVIARTQRATLRRLGWRELRSGNFIRESGKRRAGELVIDAEKALREVWEVVHPSFLTIHEPYAATRRAAPAPKTREVSVSLRGTATPGVTPDDAAHLLEMARDTLSATNGAVFHIWDNKIRLLDLKRFTTKILVSPHAMRLEFCTILGHGTPDMALLGAVIAEHSSRWPDISIVVTKDHVFAVRALECATFYPMNLLTAMNAWHEFCSDGAIDIIEQLDPEMTGHFGPPPGMMPVVLAELIEQHAADPCAIPPGEIVGRTKANTPMLRRYARICAESLADPPAADAPPGLPTPDRAAVEQFMPVLLEAIGIAAERNVAWESRHGG